MRVGTVCERTALMRLTARVIRFEWVTESVVLWIDQMMGMPSPAAAAEAKFP